jgi:HAD superfamily hydrolase (TIGR01549 family)
MSTLAVLFDAFGTLIKIKDGAHPYRTILKIGIQQGRRPKPDDAEILLSTPLSLREAADYFGITVAPEMMENLTSILDAEIQGLEAHEDGLNSVDILQAAGVSIGICSNLASPYAAAIDRLYPSITCHSYSFEVGAVKPDHRIYEHAVKSLMLPPDKIWMIGDSKICDSDEPTNFGMKGFHLDRGGNSDYTSLTAFTKDFLHNYFFN